MGLILFKQYPNRKGDLVFFKDDFDLQMLAWMQRNWYLLMLKKTLMLEFGDSLLFMCEHL